jgi:hypothetical protein
MHSIQPAEKVDVDLDFGWRSARAPSTPGFGVMGWSGSSLRSLACLMLRSILGGAAVHRCDNKLIFRACFSR